MLAGAASLDAGQYDPIFDESQVPAYTLPDPLAGAGGKRISDPAVWRDEARPAILGMFAETVYGRTPEGLPPGIGYEIIESTASALGGKATRKQVRIRFGPKDEPGLDLLIYVPNDRRGPVPAFLGLNFYGNQTVHPDPRILLNPRWMRDNPGIGIEEHRATGRTRGAFQERWQLETLIERGYALVTAYHGDLDTDRYPADYTDGVQPLFYGPGQERPLPNGWGSIGVWAWGMSRVLDYLATDDDVDHERVAVIGHSRLGKAALWAGAQDERFAMVISNNSGCGGAALFRRRFGETLTGQTAVSYWFCDNHMLFRRREHELPVDQHMLIALIAPRPVYVASAAEDLSSDPRGEFLAAKHAHPVYVMLGKEGLPAGEMPPVDEPVHGTIGYHVRSGGHGLTPYDWARYLDFGDKHLRGL
ncbi:alpha/beta hydrolase family protein [Elusimicrobiota bacterium]